jgi:hypothetical protein
MDLFNTLQWAYSDGRYTDWKSIYPPLNFLVLKLMDFGGGVGMDADFLREHSLHVVVLVIVTYFLSPLFVIRTRLWVHLPSSTKVLIYGLVITCFPFLFALERGNLILLTPPLLAVAIAYPGWLRYVAIAFLINLKPYFAVLLLFYLMCRNYRDLLQCLLWAGGIFVCTGLILDSNFILFFSNLLGFSEAKGLFSLREMMSMPSSISAISSILKTESGAEFAARFIGEGVIRTIIYSIEVCKWSALIGAIVIGFRCARFVPGQATIALLIIVISNLGIWVGGYTLILYMVLIPVFCTQPLARYLIGILVIMILPWDFLPLLKDNIGPQFSYFAGPVANVEWQLGLGSVLRPLLNFILLLMMSWVLHLHWKKDFLFNRIRSDSSVSGVIW